MDSAVLWMFRNAWLLFVAVTSLNAAVWWWRGRRHRAKDPTLVPGYKRLVRGFLFWGNLPWIAMGLPILLGQVSSVFQYFSPRTGGFLVVSWHILVAVLWVVGTNWLVFGGGAEDLIRHPGFLQYPLTNPNALKIWWFLCLAGGIAGMGVMWAGNWEVPF